MVVRWSSQTVEQEEQSRLPGYKEAVVRRFDAPEALNTRFHEVHTKSALNRIPTVGKEVRFVRCSHIGMPARRRVEWTGLLPSLVSSMLSESIPTRAAPLSTRCCAAASVRKGCPSKYASVLQ